MKTDAIKWHVINDGLKKANFNVHPSTTYSEGILGSDAVVETFTVNAPDGSQFLIAITRLKKEKDA